MVQNVKGLSALHHAFGCNLAPLAGLPTCPVFCTAWLAFSSTSLPQRQQRGKWCVLLLMKKGAGFQPNNLETTVDEQKPANQLRRSISEQIYTIQNVNNHTWRRILSINSITQDAVARLTTIFMHPT